MRRERTRVAGVVGGLLPTGRGTRVSVCVCARAQGSSGGTGNRVWVLRSDEINATERTSGWVEKFEGKMRKGFIRGVCLLFSSTSEGRAAPFRPRGARSSSLGPRCGSVSAARGPAEHYEGHWKPFLAPRLQV